MSADGVPEIRRGCYNLGAMGFRHASLLRETVSRLLEQHRIPGLSVGVVSGRDLIFSEGFGYADIESQQPMRPERRQRIASITKTMVGLCAMALVDEGRLAIDEPVSKRLPDAQFHGPAGALTVRHLLTHTGGIGEAPMPEDLARPFDLLFAEQPKGRPLADAYAKGITIEVEPGTKWAYANHGYALLGEIVSRLEGAGLEEVMRRRIFEPLRMADCDLLDQPHERLSTGYHRRISEDMLELLRRVGQEPPEEETVDGTNIRGKYQPLWDVAAGGAQSTIPDMARYAAALLDRGAGIVRPGTFQEMVSDHWRPHPRLPGWGLSFALRDFSGHRGFGHGGSAFGGWNSYISVFPDEGLAVLIHQNLAFEDFDLDIVPRIMHAAFGAPDLTVPAAPIDGRVLETAAGVYECPTPGPLTNFRPMIYHGRLQVCARHSQLVLYARRGAWKRGVQMAPAGDPDVFALLTGCPDPPLVALIRDSSGAVTRLRVPGTYDVQRCDVAPWVV